MTDPDEAVDRVLHGLREVRPDTGFEQRIASRLERLDRRAKPTTLQRLPLWLRTVLKAHGVALGGCVAALAALCLLAAPSFHVTARLPAHPLQASAPLLPVPQRQSIKDEPLLAVAPLRRAASASPHRARHPLQVRSSTSNDAALLALDHAPSMLAPAMPITEQERLLVRIARQRQPEAYALLNPAVRAKKEAEDHSSFLAFFEPPRTPGAAEPKH